MNLTNEELLNIEGGGLKLTMGTGLIIGGILTFIIGAVTGFLGSPTCSLKK